MKMMANVKQARIIAEMFTVFGQSSDAERIALYTKHLEEVPENLLRMACNKAVEQRKFIPSVAEILDDVRSLMGAADPSLHVLPFAMAWEEILQQIQDTYFDWEKPTFSRPEIKQLVDAVGGLRELRMMQTSEVPIIRAQMRKIYDEICMEAREAQINNHVLGKGELVEGLSVGKKALLQKGGAP